MYQRNRIAEIPVDGLRVVVVGHPLARDVVDVGVAGRLGHDAVAGEDTGAGYLALGDRVEIETTLAFSQRKLEEISFETLDDRKGQRDAVDPMTMVPTGQLPDPGSLPGDLLGQGTTGDAVVAVTVLESAPEGVEGSGPYLAVSPRTPYNRFPIPRMSLSATVDGAETTLGKAIHPDLGYHYGAVVDGAESASEVTITVDGIPTVARHEGYETAFMDMPPVTIEG